MNERKLNAENNDVYLDGKNVARIHDYKTRVMQNIKHMTQAFETECLTDGEQGIPWFDDVFGQPTLYADAVKQIIREKVEAVPGVKSVNKIKLVISDRNLSGTYSILLEDETTATGEF